ncbi:hypothetical protein ABT297_30505 [Dactylosporangium sp. NPDC000555]|uniref:hypothetical protein n=1 Tax=Dactylosporangium sp. NPDC000555 TaxID=3154260 RepID=UPI00332A12BB
MRHRRGRRAPRRTARRSAQGFYTRRLSAGDKRIEAILVCFDQNLYVEVRFTAGGTEPWDSAAMKTNMTALAKAMMTKVPKA